MRRAWIISALGHLALLVAILLGGMFARDRFPEVTVSEVSIISEAEYAALALPAPAPEIESEVPEVAPPPEDAPPEPPVEDTAPNVPEPAPVEEPETPDTPDIERPQPVPDAAVLDDTPLLVAPSDDVDGTALERDAVAAPAPRIAPVPQVAPPPAAETAPERVEDTAPDPEAEPEETPPPDAAPAAPDEASDRIVTEAERPREFAPASSMRPRARPQRPVRQAETEREAPRDETAEAIAADVASADPAPRGPPLTFGEREAFKLAVGACWNVDPGARSARVKVTVGFSLDRDGKVAGNDVRLIRAEGGDSGTQRAAYDAARRAVLRCQRGGYDLPVEKYERWRDIEMTFNPEGMQVR